ncbi:unnamed protein product [Fusarium venenatum]|uniref:Uncharacterized protein n=1 Tax=Fusarium venenatum TaxID=56646 RepID=A0A2L2SWN0_9HYPO|nr:uncharacterized protein FVRRES_05564 [Fusarium venenatum]CEI61128.1 unnamed protein product [Fusarium venenatum]
MSWPRMYSTAQYSIAIPSSSERYGLPRGGRSTTSEAFVILKPPAIVCFVASARARVPFIQPTSATNAKTDALPDMACLHGSGT